MIKLINISEDLRKWFGKGPTGGWDRYNTKGEKVGKCGDSEEGSAYAACLSNEKAAKLGKDGRAAFVKRKRAAQKDAGDAEKGGEKKKGQKPTFVKTGASEGISESSKEDIIKDLDKVKNDLLKKVDVLVAKKKKLYSNVDIESPMSADEKKLDKEIADLFSQINQLVLQKRSLKEAQAVSGGKVHKFITGKNLGFRGKKYSQIDFETLGVDNNNGTIRLRIVAPKEIFGNEMSLDFRTVRRGPFFKTDTSNQLGEEWSQKYKDSIDCNNPKGFSQKAHCAGKKKNESMNLEEKVNLFLEKNCPTDPAKWSASKSLAKKKFDVYPSAYANGWAAKNYKSKGGGWKKCNEGEANALCEETYPSTLDEACWDGYKQVGMKKKGDRQVPNCVPESVVKESSIGKLQKDYASVVELIQKHLGYYKSAKNDAEKKKHVEHLKKLNSTKKKIEADMEKSISGLYKDAELKVED